jgi:hypothetical protein
MKKLLTLTLGLVTLALIGTEAMVKTPAVVLNTGYSQWSEQALLTNFPNRQRTTSPTALALPNFDYNFESLVNNQTIFGQDQWANAVVGNVAVRKGPGVNQTQTAKGEGGSAGSGARRPLDQVFYYTSNDTKVVWGVWGYVPSGGNNVTAIGGILPCLFGPHQLGGITQLTTYLQRQSPLPYVTGDVLFHDHWYEYRVVVDFSVSGGSASLSYRDVTSGTAFKDDTVIKNVNLGLVPNGSGRYGFSEVYIRNDGAGYVDNLHFDAPVPTAACTTPPPNMVAWWPLDEAQGSQVVHDLAGGHDGTPMTSSGSATTVGTVGGPMSVTGSYVANSLLFDGAYVQVPDSQILNFGANGKDPFTIDTWVNYYPLQQTRPIVSKSPSPNGPGYFLSVEPAGAGVFKLTLRVNNVKYIGPAVPPNTWAFVAATRNASGVTLYVGSNNTLATPFTVPGSAKNANSTGTPLRIGQWQLSGNVHPHAQIDEVEIFNRALKKTEIEAIFNAGSAGKCKCAAPPSGLVSWWPGDGNANDIRDGNNGTLINGATLSTGKVAQAFSLDGADDYVQLSNNAYNPFPATGFTYDFWINPFDTPPGRSRTIISNHHATGNWWNGISLVNGRVEFVLQNAATGQTFYWTTSTTLMPNAWHFIAVAYQNQGDQATDAVIYLNGTPEVLVMVGPGYNTGFTPGYSATDPLGFAVGRLLEDIPSAYFRGLIDEGEFFNRALTQQEIQSIFNAGSAGKCSIPQKKGMTWFHTASNVTYGTITVGCGPSGPDRCDPAHGDTLCTQQLPVLCIYKPKPAFPLPVGLPVPNEYNRWSGGVVATTQPVAGNTFANSAAVTAFCTAVFGAGWRVAEFHDGLYWNFQAYGGTVSAPTVPSTRFWVYINDQKDGNCWKP